MNYDGFELVCPVCHGELAEISGESWQCTACDREYPVVLGIPDLRTRPDPYIDVRADHEKGKRLADSIVELDFAAAVDFYYSITPAVTPAQAEQFTGALTSAEVRSRASLDSWERTRPSPVGRSDGAMLDVGCGTAPLLVAAAERYDRTVGVDIAFRWLVLARKRLREAGLSTPLVCACAEALPFRDGAFARVVADSVLELVDDQAAASDELARVAEPGARIFVSTPNRYSAGPDPHTGLWAGGYLPASLVAGHIRRQGGVPPIRHFLSERSLRDLLQAGGLQVLSVDLPNVTPEQRQRMSGPARILVDAYRWTRRIPGPGSLLRLIGPQLHAVAQKPGSPWSNPARNG